MLNKDCSQLVRKEMARKRNWWPSERRVKDVEKKDEKDHK